MPAGRRRSQGRSFPSVGRRPMGTPSKVTLRLRTAAGPPPSAVVRWFQGRRGVKPRPTTSWLGEPHAYGKLRRKSPLDRGGSCGGGPEGPQGNSRGRKPPECDRPPFAPWKGAGNRLHRGAAFPRPSKAHCLAAVFRGRKRRRDPAPPSPLTPVSSPLMLGEAGVAVTDQQAAYAAGSSEAARGGPAGDGSPGETECRSKNSPWPRG